LGTKYYVKEKGQVPKGLFFSGELSLLATTSYATFAANPPVKRKHTDFGMAPGIGYLLGPLEASIRIQYNLPDAGFNIYYYNFRLAYAFIKRSS
jgi:hypothetical protein